MAGRRRRQKKRSKFGALAFIGMLPLIGSLPGPIVMGYTVYSNVATKSYVDEKVEESKQKTLLEVNAILNSLRTHDAVIDAEIQSIRDRVMTNSQWIEEKQSPRRR